MMKLLQCCLLIVCVVTHAHAGPPPRRDPLDNPWMVRAGFLSAHPDLEYRLLGLEAHKQGRLKAALSYFRRASLYGDKLSQAMVGEMYWQGRGVAADRALGYAWMDLAAERGYPSLLRHRERYWNELSESERIRAQRVGFTVYDEFGDRVAEPRLAAKLRGGLRNIVGSRTGFAGTTRIVIPLMGGDASIDGTDFYDRRYWEPGRYRDWQDRMWSNARGGVGVAGELESVPVDTENALGSAPGQEDRVD